MTDVVRVIGVSELVARLLKGTLLGEVAATTAVNGMAEDVAAAARELAPVQTGRLRDSITSDGNRAYTDVEYAPFVEYGTANMSAEPFLRPAADTVDGSRAEELAAVVLRTI